MNLENYLRQASACRTINELNKLHIQFENQMTPQELSALHREIAGAGPLPISFAPRLGIVGLLAGKLAGRGADEGEPAVDPAMAPLAWAEKLFAMYSKGGKPGPEAFTRKPLQGDAVLYAGPGERAGKTLALCFAGRAQRLMMPVSVFLQHVDARQVDVAFVRDAKKDGYRSGVSGVGTDLESTFERLAELFRVAEYRRAVAIGTSGGGLPAVLASLRLKLDAVLSISGNDPCDPKWKVPDGTGGQELVRRYYGAAPGRTRIHLVAGADSPRDLDAARSLASLVACDLHIIQDPNDPVGHSALVPLLMRGELSRFLADTVFQG